MVAGSRCLPLSRMKVVVVDLGVGNLHSLSSALKFLRADHVVTSSREEIPEATHLILPGVGAFDAAMQVLNARRLLAPIVEHARDRQKPLLGVCLGMQILAEGSDEGDLPGLGLVPGRFTKLTPTPAKRLKVPHVGFSRVYGMEAAGLFQGLGTSAEFYFTHSYCLMTVPPRGAIGYCDHSLPFIAAFQIGKLCGAQFHPEKSQSNGLRLLSNFLDLS